jgi:hypothetical protein
LILAATKQWTSISKKISIAEFIVGILLIIISFKYLYQFTETTGIFLSLLLTGSGLVGYIGGRRRSANLINLQLIASVVGMLLAFQFLGEVIRDAQVDCALAELYQRGRQTEARVDAVKQTETMNAVFNRLNEMEEMLTLVQQGAAKTVELRQEQQKLALTDANYIKSKVDMVKRHAEEVLDSILKNPNVTAENIALLPEEDKAAMRKKLDIADKVMDKIQKAHRNDAQPTKLTFEEYEEILSALTDMSILPEKAGDKELSQAKSELANMKAAITRQKTNSYNNLAVGEAARELSKLEQKRQKKRDNFRQQFNKMIASMANWGKDFLEDLPEHCVKETKAEKTVVLIGVVAIGLQLVSAYVSLSLSTRLGTTMKGD